jgi:hypothetical protein
LSVVDFLEARIADKEASVRRHYLNRTPSNPEEVGEPGPLGQMILAECAMKRAIVAEWWSAAAAEDAANICEADGPRAVALRSMLRILAAGYEAHPEYREVWFDRPGLPKHIDVPAAE